MSAFSNMQQIFGLGQYNPEVIQAQRDDAQKRLLEILGNKTTQQVGAFQPGVERPQIETGEAGILPQQQAELVSQLMTGAGTEKIGNKLLESLVTQSKTALKPSDIASLRNQAKPIRTEFRNLRTNFNAMNASFKGTPGVGRSAADLAMVINFAKMLDPTSVVRSEEGETIQKTAGFFGVLRGLQDQIKGEGSLDDSARRGLMLEASRQFQARSQSLDPDINFFSDTAINAGIKPSALLTKDMLDRSSQNERVNKLLESLQGKVEGGKPTAPQNPAQRQINTIYSTPKGDLKWTGTGWIKP